MLPESLYSIPDDLAREREERKDLTGEGFWDYNKSAAGVRKGERGAAHHVRETGSLSRGKGERGIMTENRKSAAPRKEKAGIPRWFFDWTEAVAWAMLAVLILFGFVMHTNTVVGRSMLPTLENGDLLLVSRLFWTPKRGDIVIVSKSGFRTEPIVKRIIAVGGQTIDIDFENREVFVDGEKLDEPYISEPTERDLGMTFPQTVPEGYVFVMGDNRNESDDSRDPALGMVDEGYLQGRVFFRYWPFRKIGSVG